jgi:hypothetical protein
MAFLVLEGEKNLAAIVRRAYGELNAVDRKRAEDALLRVNPQLANLRQAGRGALIVVPTVPGLRTGGAERTEASTPAPEAMVEVREALEAYITRLETNIETERARGAELADLLKSKDVKSLVRNVPDASRHVERVTAAVKGRAAEHDERAASVKALAQAKTALDGLAKKLR